MDEEEIRKLIKKFQVDIERDVFTSGSLSTSSNVESPDFSWDTLKAAMDKLEEISKDIIVMVLVTYLVPAGGWQMEYLGKKYVLVNKLTWYEWSESFEKVQTESLIVSLSQIPVVEDDELVKKIIYQNMEKYFNNPDWDRFKFTYRRPPYSINGGS